MNSSFNGSVVRTETLIAWRKAALKRLARYNNTTEHSHVLLRILKQRIEDYNIALAERQHRA